MSASVSPAVARGSKLAITCGATPKRRRSAHRFPSVMNSNRRSKRSFSSKVPGVSASDRGHARPFPHLVDEAVRLGTLAEGLGQHEEDVGVAEDRVVVFRVARTEGDALPLANPDGCVTLLDLEPPGSPPAPLVCLLDTVLHIVDVLDVGREDLGRVACSDAAGIPRTECSSR